MSKRFDQTYGGNVKGVEEIHFPSGDRILIVLCMEDAGDCTSLFLPNDLLLDRTSYCSGLGKPVSR